MNDFSNLFLNNVRSGTVGSVYDQSNFRSNIYSQRIQLSPGRFRLNKPEIFRRVDK